MEGDCTTETGLINTEAAAENTLGVADNPDDQVPPGNDTDNQDWLADNTVDHPDRHANNYSDDTLSVIQPTFEPNSGLALYNLPVNMELQAPSQLEISNLFDNSSDSATP